MKKTFKERVRKITQSKTVKLLGSLVKGAAVDTTLLTLSPISGAFIAVKAGLQTVFNKGKEDATGGAGKPNLPRLIAMIVSFILVILYATGKIDFETVNNTIHLIQEIGTDTE